MKQTQLYSQHKKLDARIVDFAGWQLPLQYQSITQEHLSVREACGMFDCSHMGQIFISGEDAYQFMNYVICNNLDKIGLNKGIYTGILNEKGNFLDDIIVYQLTRKKMLLVVNASNVEKIFSWLKEKSVNFSVNLVNKSAEFGLLAIQGKTSPKIINALFGKNFYQSLKRFGISTKEDKELTYICRTGYTGEEGIEVIAPSRTLNGIFEQCLKLGVIPCGLGARDSLRLERAYSLYGHEISEEINPLEAGLAWIVDFSKENFIGKDALLKKKELGQDKQRILFVSSHRPVARHGDKVVNADLEKVGFVTSGVVSPVLNYGIGIALVNYDVDMDNLQIMTKRKNFPLEKISGRDFLA